MIKITSKSAQPNSFSQTAQLAVAKTKKIHAKQIHALIQELESAESNCQKVSSLKKPGQTIAIVGIGGSSLGLQVIQEYFAIQNIVYFENIDPLDVELQISQIPIQNTVWIFISKSGETIETLATLELIQQFYNQKNEPFFQNCMVITENKPSTLTSWAKENKVIQIELPMDVGGRYSILTSVGLIPSYFWNLRLNEFTRGAKLALEKEEMIIQLVSESLQSFSRNELITVLWSYSARYKKFGFWWQQLWAESLSKKYTRDGKPAPFASTPVPLVGPTDQHSVLQQIVEGQKDKFIIFLRNSISETGKIKIAKPVTQVCQPLIGKTLGVLLAAEAKATQQSLDAVQVSNMTIEVSEHSEATLGFMFMFFQIAVLSIGEAMDINPVDQPGVELGKKLCKQILAQNDG